MPWADLTDTRLYYELHGHGEPLILIPGLGATCQFWEPILPQMASRFTAIAYDHRGVGRSIANRPARTLNDYTADLLELCDFLQLCTAHVMGLSMGGVIAQRFAIDHPRRVANMVLVSCSHEFGPYLQHMAGMISSALQYTPIESFTKTMDLLGSSPSYFDRHHQKKEPNQTATIHSASKDGMLTQLEVLCSQTRVAADYHITAPTLIIAGEYDPLIPSYYSKRMAQAIPSSDYWLVPGAGHVPFLEQPRIVMPTIVRFLESSRFSAPVRGRASERLEVVPA